MTKRAGRSIANDPGFQATLQAKAGAVCLVAKAWDYHVRVALGITNEENLEGIAQSTASRPRPISTRPARRAPFRGSKLYHWPPMYTSIQAAKSIPSSGSERPSSGMYPAA